MDLASFTDQTVVNRKTAIGGGLVALAALVLPGQVRAQAKQPDDSFVLLLKGLYQPVTHGPNLGLSMVDLNDGSYSTTRIYPVDGTPGNTNAAKPVGDFYVQFNGDLCAYHTPGGSFSMRFTGSNVNLVDDGQGGKFLEGTFELTILEEPGSINPSPVATTTWSTSCTSSLLATVPAALTSTASASSAGNEQHFARLNSAPQSQHEAQGRPRSGGPPPATRLPGSHPTAGFKGHSAALAHAIVKSLDLTDCGRRTQALWRARGWPCKSNSVCLGSSSSRARARVCVWRTAGFRPESWPQGQSTPSYAFWDVRAVRASSSRSSTICGYLR